MTREDSSPRAPLSGFQLEDSFATPDVENVETGSYLPYYYYYIIPYTIDMREKKQENN